MCVCGGGGFSLLRKKFVDVNDPLAGSPSLSKVHFRISTSVCPDPESREREMRERGESMGRGESDDKRWEREQLS